MAAQFEQGAVSDFTSQISGKLRSPIATGSFGDIYRCTVSSSVGEIEVAVKVLKIDHEKTIDRLIRTTLRELKVWIRLKHPTIVPLLGTARINSPLPALVSRWMPSGHLSGYLNKQAQTIAPSVRIKLVERIAEGVNYLHSMNVIHGDLHPRNILIDGSGNPCLTDFGLATVVGDPELQLTTVTIGRDFDTRWRAPEVIGIVSDPGRPTFKSDIYSFGSVMFFIISGDVPWKEKRSAQISVELSKKAIPARPNNICGHHYTLIKKCWSWKPGDRPEIAIILQKIGASVSLTHPEPQASTSSAGSKWDGSLIFTVTLQNESRNFEVQMTVMHVTGDLHAETWPSRIEIHIGKSGMMGRTEMQTWLRKYRACAAIVQLRPHAREANLDGCRMLLRILTERRTFATAEWELPSGNRSNNMIVFPMGTTLAAAVFPLTGIPELPGVDRVGSTNTQRQPQPQLQSQLQPQPQPQLQVQPQSRSQPQSQSLSQPQLSRFSPEIMAQPRGLVLGQQRVFMEQLMRQQIMKRQQQQAGTLQQEAPAST